MKKYRLIKKYPGSDSLGTIITGSKETMYSKGFGYRNYDWAHVETHPEYWEEVVEKDYEISSYIKKGSTTCTTTKRRGGENHKELWNIHSVKRLSDGEVFSVGDKFTGYSSEGNTILSFDELCENTLVIRTNNQGTITNTPVTGLFKSIKKVVEKDYEIISYWSPRFGDTKYLYYEGHEDWDNINKSKCHPIHSVKRLSDGEVFTLGRRVEGGIISEIHIDEDYSGGVAFSLDTSRVVSLYVIEKSVEENYKILKTCPIEGTIYSVKRLSDGEVFTLGDTIKVSQYEAPNIISRFSLTNDNSNFRNGVWIYYDGGCSHIRNAIKIKTKVNMNNAELEFIFFMKGTSGSFKTNLFKTIMSADNTNQKKLSLGFPDEVEVVRRYQQEDGYWQELLNIREND